MAEDLRDLAGIPMIMNIPVPIMKKRPRGNNAKEIRSKLDTRFKVLMDKGEKDLILKEAKQLSISMAEFIRHCAVFSAKYLQKYREDYERAEHDHSNR